MRPYQEQLQAVEVAVQAERGILSMPTGTGKSLTMALLVDRLQVRTLVVVPSLELKRQLSASFRQWFGDTPHIVIENVDSKRLDTLTDFDCLIVDEAHHSAASTYHRLNRKAWGNMFYRFFFTATPFRSRDEEQILMESICGQVIYRLDYRTAVDRGFIVPVQAFYYELPKQQMKGNTKSWAAVNSELIVKNQVRNELIAKLIRDLRDQGQSVLCLVKEILHGSNLSQATATPFANGEDGFARQCILAFNLREHLALIGTVGVIGEGVDTRPCSWVILAGGGKAKTQFMQNVGRAVRKYPGKDAATVILFRDQSHAWLEKHFKACAKILREEYGITPVKLPLP